MPAVRYTLSTADFVSDELRAAFRRRMHEIIGVALLLVAGAAAVALATWSVQDPSLSHATNAPVRNMLGLPGAIGADLMMQLLGIATVAFLFPVAAWGWRLLTHRTFDREKTRLAVWVFAALAAAGFASCLSPSKAWPLPSGLGGVVGDAILRVPAWVFGAPLFGSARFMVALFIGAVAFTALAFAAGFGWHAKTRRNGRRGRRADREGKGRARRGRGRDRGTAQPRIARLALSSALHAEDPDAARAAADLRMAAPPACRAVARPLHDPDGRAAR